MFYLLFLMLTASGDNKFFPVESVEPGLKGYGLTSFYGTRIDTFRVEVIDVLHGVNPGHTIVLAKLDGEIIKHTGVLAGMSGSPVYIDGKLLGAVAYSWTFSKDPICGITPAEEMQDMISTFGSVKGIAPLRSLLAVSGIGINPYVDSIATMFNLEAVPAGRDTGKGSLLPGAPVGIVFVDGDAVIAVMGTLTYTEGKRIFSFGHPALLSGGVELPFATGKVTGLLPSIYSSFKFISPLKVIGTTVWDGGTGVIAEIGRKPQWIEFTIDGGFKKFHYRLADYPTIIPYLTSSLTFSAIPEILGADFEGTVKADLSISMEFGGREEVLKRTYYLAGKGLHRDMTFFASGILRDNLNNQYGGLKIRSINLKLTPGKGVNIFTVKDIIVPSEEYSPDEKFRVKVVLGRYRKPDTTITMVLRSPSIEGEYYVDCLNSADLYRTMKTESFENPENIREYVHVLKGYPSNNILSLVVVSSAQTVSRSGIVLPPSKRVALSSLIENGTRLEEKIEMVLNGEIRGIAKKKIVVKRRK